MQLDKSVLCVESNPEHSEILRIFFEREGYHFVTCSTLDKCLKYVSELRFSIFILGFWVGNMYEFEVLEKVKSLHPTTPFIFFTTDARHSSREEGLKMGASAYLLKPDDIDNVLPTVNQLISQTSLA